MAIESDDIILNKIGVTHRASRRALEEYNKVPELSNYTEIDALILNLERACQASIDLGVHIISIQKLGIPQTSSDAFKILESKSLISVQTAKSLISMVGFGNIAIHEYQKLNLKIIHQIMKKEIHIFPKFLSELGFEISLESEKK